MGTVKVKATYKPVKSKAKLADMVYESGPAAINAGVEAQAVRLAGSIKSGISQAPNPSTGSGTDSYLDLKDDAIAGIDVINENYLKIRRKIYRGSKIPVFLVSTSPGEGRSAFANSMIEYGRGRLPGYHPWLRALVNAGGRPNKAYLVKGK